MAEDNKRFREEVDGTEEASRGRIRLKKNGYRRAGSGKLFNAFDGLILVLVVLVVVLLFNGKRLFRLGGDAAQSAPCRITYTLVFSGVEESFAASIAKGDMAYGESSDSLLGMVAEAVETTSHQEVGYADGVAVMKTVPGKVDLTVTLQCDGIYMPGVGCMLNASPLRVGDDLSLRFPEYVGSAECVNVSWVLTEEE